MGYMFGWIRKRKDKENADVKFKTVRRSAAWEEPAPAYRPPPVEEPVIVEQVESQGPGFLQNILIKVKRDRLTKLLLALLIGILLLLLFLAVFGSRGTITPIDIGPPSTPRSPPISISGSTPMPKQIIIDDATCFAKLAVTNQEQIRGLRFTPTLGANECMLYIFNQPGRYAFWGKDMQYPMDIIFISAGNRVVSIVENVSPCTQNCPTYQSDDPILYAVEVNAGYAENHLIDIGDPVKFVY
jgi:hypothetical protein